jgi:membrane-associated protease RseP (regulator of RpoE activity)
VVLPERLCEKEGRARLPWIFAHELTHIERRDAWACFLFGLGQVLYFYVPWFWSLRRQIRLCQEYIADAAATQQASNAEDYAQFLISFNAAPAVPVGTTGVSGHSSDLFRRITMLLKSPHAVHKHCPRWLSFSAAGVLLALAVLIAGVTFQAQAAPSTSATAAAAPVPQPGKANPLPKKDEPAKKPDPLPFLDGNLDVPPGVDAEKMREQIMKMREEMLKRMQQMQPMQGMGMAGAMGQGGMAFGGFGGGRLGVMLQTPDATLADQLDLPKGKGLVVTHVQADSAAAKAGIKEHDILLEFNGKSVANEASRLIHTMQDMKAGATVDAVVLRKGKKETIKGIILPESKHMAQGFGGMPGFQGFNANPMQAVPMVPMAPRLGGEGPGPGLGFGGGLGVQPGMNAHTVITSNFRTGDRFTTRHQEGSLIITVTGTVTDGKSKVSQVQIQDGNQTDKYESVDKVPEQYRDKVKNLIESNDKSNTRIELRAAPEDKKP